MVVILVQFSHVHKIYQRGGIGLTDVSVAIAKGDFIWLHGPTGAGKSTFLKLILREKVVSFGELKVMGYCLASMPKWQIPAFRRQLGVVFQDFRLLKQHSVLDNVALSLWLAGCSKESAYQRALRFLRLLRLAHKQHHDVLTLSGGEQQRIAIARALVHEPSLLLCDEPTGNLDEEHAAEIIQLIKQAHARGTTVILATHDKRYLQSGYGKSLELCEGKLLRCATI